MVMSELKRKGAYILPISKDEFFLYITDTDFSIIWNLKKVKEDWKSTKVDVAYKIDFLDLSNTSDYIGDDSYLLSNDWELFSELPKHQVLRNAQVVNIYESRFKEWQNRKLHTEAQKMNNGKKQKGWFQFETKICV